MPGYRWTSTAGLPLEERTRTLYFVATWSRLERRGALTASRHDGRVPGMAPRRSPGPRVVAVVNLKGGTAKTTTAVHLAAAYAAAGQRVLLVDADPQGQSLRWSELADDFPVPTIALPVKDLHKRLPGIVHPERTDVVVIDTPPNADRLGIVLGTLRAATSVVVPLAPTLGELDRLSAVWRVAEEVEDYLDEPLRMGVLLSRVDFRARARRDLREVLVEQGHTVLRTEVPRREAIAQAFGDVPKVDHWWADAASEVEAWHASTHRRRAS